MFWCTQSEKGGIFRVRVDASRIAEGGVLYQEQDGQNRVVGFASRVLHKLSEIHTVILKGKVMPFYGRRHMSGDIFYWVEPSRFTLTTSHAYQ